MGKRGIFQAEVQPIPSGARVVLSGVIDERAQFPRFDSNGKTIEIDLKNVHYMSSYGVRLWNEWMTYHKTAKHVVLDHVPAVIVKQFNMFHGFLGANVFVRSLYAPYVHPVSLEDRQVLLEHGKHYEKGNINLPVEQAPDGTLLEPDFLVDNFFRFLKR
ncbi:MAG: hypothetical protein AB7H97_21325 [Pseudobdellovibrionaceae bacterium]